MDPTVPKGLNQLGRLSEMHNLAEALDPYLQQHPVAAKVSFTFCIVLREFVSHHQSWAYSLIKVKFRP